MGLRSFAIYRYVSLRHRRERDQILLAKLEVLPGNGGFVLCKYLT